MRNNEYDLRVSARSARLTAAADDDDDGPPWRFGGIAVAAGDILRKPDGTRVLFTAEELQKAAETQAGEPLTKDHPEDGGGRPKYPPDVDETFGKVPKAGWIPTAEAVGYEATTHDEAVATGVQAGSYDVSVHPFFNEEPHAGPGADVKAVDIDFGDLSVVSKGDSPSNTAQWGPNQALASLTASAEFIDDLEASADGGGDDVDDPEGLISSAVRGTFRAIGLSPGDIGDGIDMETTAAESAADDGSSNTTMENDTREQYVSFLTANADFDEESLEGMDDDVLEQTHQIVAEAATDSGDGDSTTETTGDGPDDGPDDEKTLGEMTPDEAVDTLADGLRDQGFVTEDNADELVQQAQAQATKQEQVDEIIAKSDDYDEDDRDDLLASADSVIDREHSRVRREQAVGLPGTAGAAGTLTASEGSKDDLDDYGTGVEGDD